MTAPMLVEAKCRTRKALVRVMFPSTAIAAEDANEGTGFRDRCCRSKGYA